MAPALVAVGLCQNAFGSPIRKADINSTPGSLQQIGADDAQSEQQSSIKLKVRVSSIDDSIATFFFVQADQRPWRTFCQHATLGVEYSGSSGDYTQSEVRSARCGTRKAVYRRTARSASITGPMKVTTDSGRRNRA